MGEWALGTGCHRVSATLGEGSLYAMRWSHRRSCPSRPLAAFSSDAPRRRRSLRAERGRTDETSDRGGDEPRHRRRDTSEPRNFEHATPHEQRHAWKLDLGGQTAVV